MLSMASLVASCGVCASLLLGMPASSNTQASGSPVTFERMAKQPSLPIGQILLKVRHRNNSDAGKGHVDVWGNGQILKSVTLNKHGEATITGLLTNVQLEIVATDNGERGTYSLKLFNDKPVRDVSFKIR